MTTNHVERLDAALIRPGRVDVSQHFGNCTPIMIEQVYNFFKFWVDGNLLLGDDCG